MTGTPQLIDDDFELIECRTNIRIVLSAPARFTLANRRNLDGDRKEFNGRVVNMSCHIITLLTPIIGELGERVIVQVDEFGRFEGRIDRIMTGGFSVEIITSQSERRRLAARIDWYEKHKHHDVENLRGHVRIIPRNPYSTLVLADGTTVDCLVKDVSASGIAVLGDVVPAIGTPVAVGKIVGRVVRHFSDGFAVQFVELQDVDKVEALVARLN